MRVVPSVVVTGLLLTTIGSITTPQQAVAAATASVTCATAPAATAAPESALDSYHAITPVRLVDSRDGTGGFTGQVGAGCTLQLDLTGSVAPTDADAVALSLTAIAAERGFYTVYPCANGRPDTSNLNARPNVPTPNLVVATPDASGIVCIFSLKESHLIIDLAGWWSPGPDRFQTITPVRADDSRLTNSSPLPAESVRSVVLAGSILPTDATAALINLTVTEPADFGFLTAYPCGTEPPRASNLNFVPGESRAVSAIVGIGDAGAICIFSSTSHHVVIDVVGFYSPAPQFGPTVSLTSLIGERIASSRDGIGGWSGPFSAGTVRQLDPVLTLNPGSGANADTASSVVLNVTTVNAGAPGFVTVYPCVADRPFVSAVNYVPNSEATNLVVVDLSAARTVCFYTSSAVDVIVDLFGVMHAPASSLAEGITFDSYTWPPFDPSASDYIVECGTDGQVQFDLDLLPSVTARLNGISIAAGSTTVDANPDDLLRLRLTRGTEVDSYWFRCVPTDFPRLLVDRSGEPDPGWYLTSVQKPGSTAGYLAILDHHGAPVWYKRVPGGGFDVKRRSDGRLIYTPNLGNAFGLKPERGYRITTLSGTLVAEHLTDDPTNFPTDHHDYVELAGGGRAMLSYPLVTGQNLNTPLGAGYFANDTIVDGVIQEIDAAGNLLWSWRTSDYFGYDEVRFPVRFGLYPSEPNGGEVDVWHLNSLDQVDDDTDDFVLSARHLDAVFRVDHVTKDVDWILGSGSTNPAALTIIGDPLGGPLRPHDARLNGDVLTLFDNRHANGLGQAARAVAYRIDDVANTATMLWQIANPTGQSSFGLGSTRVAADGDVLVAWGGLQPLFQEFTSSGDPLMTITQEGGGNSYRIVKEPPASFDINVLRSNAGGTAEVP